MKDNDKILARLIAILEKLSENESPRIKDLAKEFKVTERTIQRDIYQRLHYFPIEKNGLGQLQFIKGFSFDKSLLHSDEIMFIYLALSQIKDNHPDFQNKIDTIVHKLLKPHVHQKEAPSEEVNQKVLTNIESALLRNQVVTVELSHKHIDIKPYKLMKNGEGYMLLGEDCKDGHVKTIPLSQINEVSKQTTRFKVKRSMKDTLNNVHTAWFDGPNLDME